MPGLAADTNGYYVWFPEFHGNSGGNYYNANCFAFANSATNVRPTNTTAAPMGVASLNTTGLFIADPMYPNLNNNASFARAKTLAACLQVEYTGQLSAMAGQVAIIQNYSLEAFNANTGNAGEFIPPSVDEMFSYAAVRERFQLDGHEVVWRPNVNAAVFRSADVEATNTGDKPDSCFFAGQTAATATKLATPNPQNVYGIAIAWRGIPSTANCIAINCVKVADLELAARNNVIENPIKAESASSDSSFGMGQVLSFLDTYTPGWQTKSINMAAKMAASAVSSVYAPSGLINNAGPSTLRGYPMIMDGEL